MKPKEVETYALLQLKKLMQRHDTKKTKLGEVLSDRTGEEPQKKFLRAQRFLNGQGSLKIEKMVRIAQFYSQPITYFFPPELTTPYTLNHNKVSTNNKLNKPLAAIETRLRDMGFDENFIKSEIKQLRALESYESE